MAESGDDPVLVIRVEGDFSEFDEGVRRREESIGNRPMVFGTEGSRVGSLPGMTAQSSLNLDRLQQAMERLVGVFGGQRALTANVPRAFLPSPENSSFSSATPYQLPQYEAPQPVQIGGQTRYRDPNTGRFVTYTPPTASASAVTSQQPAETAQTPASTIAFAAATGAAAVVSENRQRALPYYPSGGSTELSVTPGVTGGRRYNDGGSTALARRPRGYSAEEVYDAEWEPAAGAGGSGPTALSTVVGGAGGGGGGGTGYNVNIGGGGLTPPGFYGGGGGGGGGGGFPATWGFGGWAASAVRNGWTGFRNVLASIPRRAVYSTIFGLWEASRVQRAGEEGDLAVGYATTPMEMLQARSTQIQQQTSGIFSGIIGATMDVLNTSNSPQNLRSLLSGEEYTLGRQQNTFQLMHQTRLMEAVRDATPHGVGAIQLARSNEERNERVRALREQGGFLRSQFNATEEVYLGDNIGHKIIRGIQRIGGGENSLDPINIKIRQNVVRGSQRSALATNIRAIDALIAGETEQSAYELQEYTKDLFGINAGILARGQNAEDVYNTNFTPSQRSERALRSQQRLEEIQVARQTPDLLPALKQTHEREIRALTYQNQINERAADLNTEGYVRTIGVQAASQVNVMELTGQRRFYEAAQAQITGGYQVSRSRILGQYQAAYQAATGNLPEQARLTSQAVADVAALDQTTGAQRTLLAQQEGFRRQQALTQVTGQTQTLTLTLDHRPLAAAINELRTQASVALAEVPADNPALRNALAQQYKAREQLIRQQFRENRYLETQELSLQETVTGIQATAFGPGARTRRAQAEITSIAGGAELRAEQRLLNDRTDMANADRERRIGINQLGAFRANYIEGLQAVEGSIFRTNLTGTAAGNPTEILKSVDNGIKLLTNKISTLVATD